MYTPKYLNLDQWLSPSFTYQPSYSWSRNLNSLNQASATIYAANTFNASFNLSISKFIERFYNSGTQGSSRSSRNRYSKSSSTSNNSNNKPFEAKNIYVKSLLKFLHKLSQKLSGFNVSYKKIIRVIQKETDKKMVMELEKLMKNL